MASMMDEMQKTLARRRAKVDAPQKGDDVSQYLTFVWGPSEMTSLFFKMQTHPEVMTGNGQLTRGAFIINDFLRNPHFSRGVAKGWSVGGSD